MSVQTIAGRGSLCRAATRVIIHDWWQPLRFDARRLRAQGYVASFHHAAHPEDPAQTRRIRPYLSRRAVLPSEKCTFTQAYSQAPSTETETHLDPEAPVDPLRAELRDIVDVYETFRPVKRRHRGRDSRVANPWGDNQRDPQASPARDSSDRKYAEPTDETWPQIQRVHDLLDDKQVRPQEVFDAYRALPSPRLAYFITTDVERIGKSLQWLEEKGEQDMLRYCAFLDDLRECHIQLTDHDWRSAMAFAKTITTENGRVEFAMQVFSRMERDGSSVAGTTTFNILFEIASKAARFALAESILKEMQRRGLEPDFFTYTSKIFYNGLRRDGHGVRQAYRDFVDSGGIIDVTVLTCVVVSLIRAGEPAAAEQLLERMKELSSRRTDEIGRPRSWRRQKIYRSLFTQADLDTQNHSKNRHLLQNAMPLGPTIHTYRAVIRYHTAETGNIDRVMELMGDMKRYGLKWHGSLFFHIFRGFHRYGGTRFTSWTRRQLDDTWHSFLNQVDSADEDEHDNQEELYKDERACTINLSIASAILRAFGKCSDYAAVKGVERELAQRWTPTAEEQRSIEALVDEIRTQQDAHDVFS